jgi:hypothetical protein
VDDMRKNLLTTTALAGDQNRDISRCNLVCDIYSPVQQRRITDDAKALFNFLNVHIADVQICKYAYV